MSSGNARPQFSPVPCLTEYLHDTLSHEGANHEWVPIIQCPADFNTENVSNANLMLAFVLHA